MSKIEVPVLIVGGGGTGLAAANFLADLGIDYLLVERHQATSHLPKAHYVNQRSMEIFRRHGIADAIAREAAPRENMGKILWGTSLGGDGPLDGKTFVALDVMGGGDLAEIYDRHGPTPPAHIPQLLLEPILFRAARARTPERILFRHELVSFAQDEGGVRAIIRNLDAADKFEVRARFMIAADGGKTVGPSLGIAMQGIPNMADYVLAFFSADLSSYIHRDDSVMRMIIRPDLPGSSVHQGSLLSMGPDRWDRHCRQWAVSWAYAPGDPTAKDDSDIVARVKAFLKVDVPIDLHHVSHWELGSLIADKFRDGSVFIAGDAAHKHTPIGGLGLNSGIQDVHNLTWKLALVLQGHAHERLLDSYEAERRPVIERNADMSMFGAISHGITVAGLGIFSEAPPKANEAEIMQLLADTPGGESRRARMREVFRITRAEYAGQDQELGFCYASGAVVDDGSPPAPRDPMGSLYTPNTRPGSRLPHVWLRQNANTVSTHDLIPFGGFLLLTSETGEPWCTAARKIAAETGIAIAAFRVGGASADLQDAEGAWQQVAALEKSGAVLVRPDGHVAFRACAGSADAAATLRAAIQSVLGFSDARGEPARTGRNT